MSEPSTPSWTERLDEPFRSDRAFSRSVAASADALLLIVVAAIAAVLLGWAHAPLGIIVLPFLAPLALMGWSLLAAREFHRDLADEAVSSEEARVSWRVRERQAVASVFGPALIRNRFSHA
jgi:hypothetical protein